MNQYDIRHARNRYALHPVLGPATATLCHLERAANENSDGWHSWPKPARSAEKLMALIEGDEHPGGRSGAMFDPTRADATVEKLRTALRPIKAFRTRSGLEFDIEEPAWAGRYPRGEK
jgi:hypothetical protein